jgi:rhombotail lipoprotein
MKYRTIAGLCLVSVLCGCTAIDQIMCTPHCRSETHNSSSLVGFLYPDGQLPAPEDTVPELRVPMRVGLAFLPSQNPGAAPDLDAAHKEEILERIRARFAAKKFVREIVIIPDYYLANNHGFEGLRGVQRLYNIDVMALVSYDQVSHLDQNNLSLGYLTIVGAFVLRGSVHDTATLVDLAVVDPATRSLIIRAGGTDTRHDSATLVDEQRKSRATGAGSFDAASEKMIGHFDTALTALEESVKTGKAGLHVVSRNDESRSHFGGGALNSGELAGLMLLASNAAVRRRGQTGRTPH